MIIGHGDLASAIIDQRDKIFFASGVSNSACTNWFEFQREKDLLMNQNKFSHLVYFSSLSIYYTDTPYTRHKKVMERLVKDNFAVSTIVRIGNITWGINPNTLLNYFKNKIANREDVEIKDEYRYLLSKGEFQHWMKLIPDFTTEMNLTGIKMSVDEVFKYVYNNSLI